MTINEARTILGLSEKVSHVEIRKAFRQMAKLFHPDRYGSFTQKAWATHKFIKIKAAYDLLISSANLNGIDVEVKDGKEEFEEDVIIDNKFKHQTFDLFDWILSKLPDHETTKGFIIFLLTLPFTIGFIPYAFLLIIFGGILTDMGIYRGQKIRDRILFLIVMVIPALPYFILLISLILVAFKRGLSGNISDLLLLTLFILATLPVVFFVISELISFFFLCFWQRAIKAELKKYSPIR
jgi:hypothetical protein